MAALLPDAATWLGEQLRKSAGSEITYVRRDGCVALAAWPARHEYEVLDEDGIPTRVLSFDWTCLARDLVLGGHPLEPRAGDRLVEIDDGAELVFEVMPLGNKPCYERLDAGGRLLLIHTKQVS
jgi:hypothetical protein